jgi:hypothetical protein
MKIRCFVCGKSVCAVELPEGTVIGAVIECPECVALEPEAGGEMAAAETAQVGLTTATATLTRITAATIALGEELLAAVAAFDRTAGSDRATKPTPVQMEAALRLRDAVRAAAALFCIQARPPSPALSGGREELLRRVDEFIRDLPAALVGSEVAGTMRLAVERIRGILSPEPGGSAPGGEVN